MYLRLYVHSFVMCFGFNASAPLEINQIILKHPKLECGRILYFSWFNLAEGRARGRNLNTTHL